MTDMQAAVGRVQLTRLPAIVAERRQLAQRNTPRGWPAIHGVTAPVEPAWARTNWQSYCVELPETCDQRAVMQQMLDAGVSTRRGVMNAHLELPYQSARHPHRSAAQRTTRSSAA